MANRIMEAKAFKLQRQLRKLPRPMYDDVPGQFPDSRPREIPKRLGAEGVVAPRQPNSELMQGYKHRAASLGREDNPGKFTGIPPARLQVIQQLERIASLYSADKSFTLLDTRVHRARVFFNPPRTVYILLYEQHKQGVITTSFPHCDKKELVDKFRRNQLQWVELCSSRCNREGG